MPAVSLLPISGRAKAPNPFHRNSIGYLQETKCSYRPSIRGCSRAKSPQPGSLPNAQSYRLIIVWLEVRVLPAPPCSLTQTEISRFMANSPELAEIRARILSLQAVDWISGAVSTPLSLARKIAFPHGRGRRWWRLGSNAESVRWKANERLAQHVHAAAHPKI